MSDGKNDEARGNHGAPPIDWRKPPGAKCLILGLTGSIGSGKSTVSALLQKCGGQIICADTLAREAVLPGTPALAEIAEAFGPGMLLPDGSLDRQAMASAVFPDPDKRRLLESIVLPRVRALVSGLLTQYAGQPLIVLDIPLLFESGYAALCDATVSVTIPESLRLERLTTARGMTPKQIQARVGSQLPQDEKNRRATHVIDNSGTTAHTSHQVASLLEQLFPEGLPEGLGKPGDVVA